MTTSVTESINERISRSRTPMNSVYSYRYPLKYTSYFDALYDDYASNLYRPLSSYVDDFVRNSRAMSESRIWDPYYDYCAELSYWPHSLSIARARSLSPVRNTSSYDLEDYRSSYRSSTPVETTVTTSSSYREETPHYSINWNNPPRTYTYRDARATTPFTTTSTPTATSYYNTYRDTTPSLADREYTPYRTFRSTPPTSASRAATPNYRASTPPNMRTTSISYGSTSPWNATGFYYSPRYPEAYRGTSSSVSPYSYSRRYFDYDVYNPYRIEYFKYPNVRNLRDYGYVPYKYSRKHTMNR
ncbi:hypothetical protein TCAL_04713 [Tigriopus californicus]|uniref:Uncharacterized protein n=2 Tax=Tigriopus californicus TaxID=6832 RepID=A0A553PRT7_TIGCA|nr:DNA-directed RNA polymerase II subunit RPB1-like isoform X1 [Tigriopus californicus]TRY80400.1 hypothetical protein TCAL_04713 [Tigriopus californicus]|eukprot:TCALIF_04713-PA protein Name:"Protein of unknown function" AED:0.00 eAED:0.00 QI:235/1/1/1/0.8/0.83/6/317/300